VPSEGSRRSTATAEHAHSISAPLEQLRRGEITLDTYLDYRADEGVRGISHLVSPAQLEAIRQAMREQLAQDPVLLALVHQVTEPEGSTDESM
jgi:hypothetical protein